jgi:hypothetical protein
MPLVTRVFASSEHAWDPMASSSVNFCRKKRTVPQRSSPPAEPPPSESRPADRRFFVGEDDVRRFEEEEGAAVGVFITLPCPLSDDAAFSVVRESRGRMMRKSHAREACYWITHPLDFQLETGVNLNSTRVLPTPD